MRTSVVVRHCTMSEDPPIGEFFEDVPAIPEDENMTAEELAEALQRQVVALTHNFDTMQLRARGLDREVASLTAKNASLDLQVKKKDETSQGPGAGSAIAALQGLGLDSCDVETVDLGKLGFVLDPTDPKVVRVERRSGIFGSKACDRTPPTEAVVKAAVTTLMANRKLVDACDMKKLVAFMIHLLKGEFTALKIEALDQSASALRVTTRQ